MANRYQNKLDVGIAQPSPSPLLSLANKSAKVTYLKERIASRVDFDLLDPEARKTLQTALPKVLDIWDEDLTQSNNYFTALFVYSSMPMLKTPGVSTPDYGGVGRYHISPAVAVELASLAVEFPRMSQKKDLLGMLWKVLEDHHWAHPPRFRRAPQSATLSPEALKDFARKLRSFELDWITLEDTAGNVKPWETTYVEKLYWMKWMEPRHIMSEKGPLYYSLSRWPPEEEKTYQEDKAEFEHDEAVEKEKAERAKISAHKALLKALKDAGVDLIPEEDDDRNE